MEIIFRILAWDFGDSFSSAFDSWWDFTLIASLVCAGIFALAAIAISAKKYLFDEEQVIEQFDYIPTALFLIIGLPITIMMTTCLSFVLLVVLMFWDIVAGIALSYGLLRTARGVIRLKRSLDAHKEDKEAHQ